MSWLYNALIGSGRPTVQIANPSAASHSPADKPPPYTDAVPREPLARQPLSLPALDQLRNARVILASASPRRKKLLEHFGFRKLEVRPSTFPENLSKIDHAPWEYVLQTALGKCQQVYTDLTADENEEEPALVLAADTVIVTSVGEILEKPASDEDHFRMLKALRDGPPHKVYTAVVVMAPLESLQHPGYSQEQIVEETVVTFDKFVTDELLWSYIRTREGMDKAGGYALQGLGSILVEKIEGSADNVIGLPLRATLKAIERVLSADEMDDGMEETQL